MRPTPDPKPDGRAHTKKKKKSFKTKTATPAQPAIVHTKRKEIEGEDGWIHIVDKPRSFQPDASAKKHILQGGDFEVKGVSYVHRTLVEMKEDFEHWKRSWEDRPTCEILKDKLKEVEMDRKISNVVVLGLGSLQSARREGRRSSATQLAALQSIVDGLQNKSEIQVVFQDPQFTVLDKEFLVSLGYTVVKDPQAFAEVGEGSLVYAIHCYADVYKAVAERPKPAVLIGTDIGNFARFDASEDTMAKELEKMVDGYEAIEFPQLRHDFSDTKIYLRPTSKGESELQTPVATEETKSEESQTQEIPIAIEKNKSEGSKSNDTPTVTAEAESKESKPEETLISVEEYKADESKLEAIPILTRNEAQ
ncbi:uncharacterized protein RAG0_16243 [Rhynchosporium agropyri]|uniref:SRR1-like domain-containing protein n=1 Tax=Rhynchosporium agropyri TaxID=914238 RepID=A0A1E1LPN2_9HELO|nr:uncharacterized protein RAG0_16243 [Rhynchosporium agropyri]